MLEERKDYGLLVNIPRCGIGSPGSLNTDSWRDGVCVSSKKLTTTQTI